MRQASHFVQVLNRRSAWRFPVARLRTLSRSKAMDRSEALAHECGINRTYLSEVERSERNVSIDNIARIARGLKVKACILLDDGKGPASG